jgi:ribosomal protein S18 acetylase RimI-like enzyme
LEFRILILPVDKTYEAALTDLLLDVYVGGGFSDRVWATTAFHADEVRKRGEVFVAESNGELLGSVVLNCPGGEFRQIGRDHEAEIHLLAVKSNARKHGIATALIRRCEERAQALGFRAIALSTQPKMMAAQALYRRVGYQRNPDRDWSNKDGKPYLAFEKKLNS